MASAWLDEYLRRIGVTGPGAPDLAALCRLHAAHVEAIPFENLDILLGRGVQLGADRLREKLIAARRGGYCFEQNTLFLAVLRELGFTAMPLEARVRAGAASLRPRTHMVLVVDIDGASWLADVGFGGEGPREPISMRGEVSLQPPNCAYRVVVEGDGRVMQMQSGAAWVDQYAFLLQPVHAIDFEVANWYTSTHPASPFVRTLTAQRATAAVRYVLRYPNFSEITEVGASTRQITRDELLPLLRAVFGIDLPDATVLPAIDDPRAPALASSR